jgi:hypothetical protein
MYLASSLRRIEGNQAIISILNTREMDVVVQIPAVKWEEYKPETSHAGDPLRYIAVVTPVKEKGKTNRRDES